MKREKLITILMLIAFTFSFSHGLLIKVQEKHHCCSTTNTLKHLTQKSCCKCDSACDNQCFQTSVFILPFTASFENILPSKVMIFFKPSLYHFQMHQTFLKPPIV